MKNLKTIRLLFLSTMMLAFGHAMAQSPTAIIKVEALSPNEIHELGWLSPPSNGLKVIGKGELIYLSGHEASGEQITSYQWSFSNLPAGSNAILDSTDTQWTTFRPDTTGQFVVQLTISTASGSDDTTITITSAKYVGVGTVGGQSPDVSKGQCAVCHSDKEAEWESTGHSTMFQLAIDGLKSSHYNESCIECHTVGYNKDSTAVNDGFDDIAAALGWKFPETLQVGNWDSLVANYPDLAAKANIQCENCHGPGSLHFGDKSKIDITLDEGMCGRCHEEPPYHVKNVQWERSAHAVGVAFAAPRAECAECHSGYGFIDRMEGKSELRTGFPQISCAVCHDPHSAENEHQIRSVDDITLKNGEIVSFGSLGKFCMNCHHSRRDAKTYAQEWHSHFGPHHSNQADMLAGTNAIDFGLPIPSSNHKNVVPEACVTCHMAATPAPDQPGHDRVGEHTFAMHWDGGTPDDPSDDVDNVAPCQQCHGNISSFEDIKAKQDYDGDGVIEAAQDEVKGLLDEVGKLLPPLGDPAIAIDLNPTTDPNYTPVQLLAAYDYKFVQEDGSYGIHNYQYAIHLLQAAHAALTTGDIGAGAIESIADVPNDQGKKVRIVWSRFGGDGVANNPLKFYALWRRVDASAKVVGKVTQTDKVFNSLGALPASLEKLEPGARVMFEGGLWDFAGTVPAAGLEKYSALAPTLFDSTKFDGMHWSVFMVSGHTDIPAIYAVSAPDSGYSLDNLAPAAPANVTGKETEMGITLQWAKSRDEDFKFFTVYRSTSPGFDPKLSNPIAKLTENQYIDTDVQVGTTYYYRVTSFDFSGNESLPSNEVPVVVTSVAMGSSEAIPDNYELAQNYPNPFNPSTVIRFGLPEATHAKLTVYNLLGIPIRVLAEGKFGAGYHTLIWDAKNDKGQLVGGGTYIYRLETPQGVLTRKMVLIK